jgi:hypothetical protein
LQEEQDKKKAVGKKKTEIAEEKPFRTMANF